MTFWTYRIPSWSSFVSMSEDALATCMCVSTSDTNRDTPCQSMRVTLLLVVPDYEY